MNAGAVREERRYFFVPFSGTASLPFSSASSASRTCLNSLRSALSTLGKCRSSLSSARRWSSRSRRGRTICGRPAPRTMAPARVEVCRIMSWYAAMVSRPQRALGDVAHRELPVLRGLFQPVEKALALLLPGNVEEEFQDHRAVAREITLDRGNVLEPFAPDILGHQLRRNLLACRGFPGAPAPPGIPRNRSD